MAVPAITRTWKQLLTGGVPGKRQAWSTLTDQTQQLLFNVKDFLVNSSGATTKYTHIWSASAGVGPATAADHTDRWGSSANIFPSATVAAASQAWCIVQDAYGVQILFAFQGASTDRARISISPGGLFALAATTNQQPTATDEQVIVSGLSVVGAAAVTDRILHVWASDDAKAFRMAILTASAHAAPVWGVEDFQPSTVSPPATFTPTVWGFCFDASNLAAGDTAYGAYTAAAPARGGLARGTVASTPVNVQVQLGVEGTMISGAYHSMSTSQNVNELQGSAFVPYPISMHSFTATARGRVGNSVDWLCCGPTGAAVFDGFGTSFQWIQVGTGILWPNPSNFQPTIA